MSEDMRGKGRPMEDWISYALLFGVILATAILLAGLILFFAKGTGGASTFDDLIHQQNMSGRLGSILHGVARADPDSVINLGVLALILTPIARVGMSVLLFLRERDRVFVLITAAVLCILLGGLIGSALT